jgi:CheY-like chemotaxis protein
MSDTKRSVLFVGFDEATFQSLSADTASRGFFSDWVEQPSDANELLTLLPFDAIVIAHPLPELSARFLLGAIRRSESPSRAAGVVVVVTDQEGVADRQELIELGANAVLTPAEAETGLPRLFKELTQVAQRFPVKMMSRVRSRLGSVDVQSLCQTVNLSATGMLLRGDQVIPPGTEISFDLHVPGDPKPIRGRAVVTRHTFARKEKVAGLGARFISFEENDVIRLKALLENL